MAAATRMADSGKQLERLMAWYGAHRDDEWEHRHGLKLIPLETRPGWSLIIDTTGTELEAEVMTEQRLARSETDWLQWSFEAGSFRASGGQKNLGDMIEKFFEEIERLADVYQRR